MGKLLIVQGRPGAPTFLVVLLWSGSVASIPAGFSLCDGSGTTLDLTDQFVVSSGYLDAGTTGGADTVDLSHDHATYSDPNDHQHSWSGETDDAPDYQFALEAGDTAVGASHTHPYSFTTTDDPPRDFSHNHAMPATDLDPLASVDLRPPYYALCFIQGLISDVPIGGIVVYTGLVDLIPVGWHLCDGDAGTPYLNLPDYTTTFIVGAGGAYDVNDSAGWSWDADAGLSHIHANGELVSSSEDHEHVVNVPTGTFNGSGTPVAHYDSTDPPGTPPNLVDRPHRHDGGPDTFTGVMHEHTMEGTGVPNFPNITETLPRYVTAAYVMRIAA